MANESAAFIRYFRKESRIGGSCFKYVSEGLEKGMMLAAAAVLPSKTKEENLRGLPDFDYSPAEAISEFNNLIGEQDHGIPLLRVGYLPEKRIYDDETNFEVSLLLDESRLRGHKILLYDSMPRLIQSISKGNIDFFVSGLLVPDKHDKQEGGVVTDIVNRAERLVQVANQKKVGGLIVSAVADTPLQERIKSAGISFLGRPPVYKKLIPILASLIYGQSHLVAGPMP